MTIGVLVSPVAQQPVELGEFGGPPGEDRRRGRKLTRHSDRGRRTAGGSRLGRLAPGLFLGSSPVRKRLVPQRPQGPARQPEELLVGGNHGRRRDPPPGLKIHDRAVRTEMKRLQQIAPWEPAAAAQLRSASPSVCFPGSVRSVACIAEVSRNPSGRDQQVFWFGPGLVGVLTFDTIPVRHRSTQAATRPDL